MTTVNCAIDHMPLFASTAKPNKDKFVASLSKNKAKQSKITAYFSVQISFQISFIFPSFPDFIISLSQFAKQYLIKNPNNV